MPAAVLLLLLFRQQVFHYAHRSCGSGLWKGQRWEGGEGEKGEGFPLIMVLEASMGLYRGWWGAEAWGAGMREGHSLMAVISSWRSKLQDAHLLAEGLYAWLSFLTAWWPQGRAKHACHHTQQNWFCRSFLGPVLQPMVTSSVSPRARCPPTLGSSHLLL